VTREMPSGLTAMNAAPLPELLAPAGSPEALEAAVAAGADAVYLSGKKFGARRFAANFDETGLQDAVAYCHARGVAVYVTVNTLIRDDELADAARTLVWLHAIGVDAVLVQDVGLMAIGRRIVPDLVLHASTQMSIHNREGVAWAQRHGLRRVVLARELPLDEIEGIARSLGDACPGLEIFVHGALCYCYSGQCLFSSIVGGRSGNRGMCAQPCRKAYALVQGREDAYGRPSSLVTERTPGAYLLSPRDLAVYTHLDRIVRSPVDSLKIEGRMRSADYVATVVGIYRRALDAIKKGRWRPSDADMRDLLLAFNRGFTIGYLLGARGPDLMGSERPDNRGIAIGRVIAYDAATGEAKLRLSGDLVPRHGDGIVFRPAAGGEPVGMVIRKIRRSRDGSLEIRVPRAVDAGWEVAITRRASLSHGRDAPGCRSTPLDLTVRWDDGRPVLHGRMAGKGGVLLSFEMAADLVMEPARTRPLDAAALEKLLRRTGDTPFVVRSLDLHYPGGLFSPIQEINRMRRDFLSMAEAVLLASYRPSEVAVAAARDRCRALEATGAGRSHPPVSVPETVLAAVTDSLEGVAGAVRGGCGRIYFEVPYGGRRGTCGYGREGTEDAGTARGRLIRMLGEASRICREADAALIWKWPRITRRTFLDRALAVLDEGAGGVAGVMVDHAGAAEAVRERSSRIPVYGSVGLNVFNHETAGAYADLFSSLTLSQELSSVQLAGLVRRFRAGAHAPALEYIVQGPAELMVSEDCLLSTHLGRASCRRREWWGIRDDAGRVFPLRCDAECRTHIFNCVETCLVDRMPELLGIGFDSLVIDARGRTERYAEDVARIYAESLAIARNPGPPMEGDLARLKELIKERAIGGITSGHFLRGVCDE
jgi:putative protease